MAADPEESGFPCENCGETFESRDALDEHMDEAHGITPEERAERNDGNRSGEEANESAAAGADAAGSTGSITEETNDAPSAAEPAEAAGPSGDTDVSPDADDDADGS